MEPQRHGEHREDRSRNHENTNKTGRKRGELNGGAVPPYYAGMEEGHPHPSWACVFLNRRKQRERRKRSLFSLFPPVQGFQGAQSRRGRSSPVMCGSFLPEE